MERVSDNITKEDILSWQKDVVIIKAPTGSGKSYFVKNSIYKVAKQNNKKILFLIHRSNCKNQFEMEIAESGSDDVIDIKTYQILEARKHKYKKNFDFSSYQYIVCDEFHYFMGDAAFNKTTDISLNMILKQTHTTRIFMSATGDFVKEYINKVKKIKSIDYELNITYEYISSLKFFNKDESMELFMEEAIKNKDKAIFFIQSAKKAYELYFKYKDYCLFNCSKSNESGFYKYVDNNKITEMLKNERFEEQILITTSCLDAGVNIIDTDLKHIVVDIEDIGSLIQCIGRKRIQSKDDTFHLYVKGISNKQLGGKITNLNNRIKMADYLDEHTVKEYIEKYSRTYDANNIVYDDVVEEADKGTKVINELMYFKCKNDLKIINMMLKRYGDFGYYKYIATTLGFFDKDYGRYTYQIIEEDFKNTQLERYLDKLKGKALWKDAQDELIQFIGLKDKKYRLQTSVNQLNSYLESNEIPYKIISKEDRRKLKNGKRNNYFGKRYWIITKIKKMDSTA